jgi:hypothetical protein
MNLNFYECISISIHEIQNSKKIGQFFYKKIRPLNKKWISEKLDLIKTEVPKVFSGTLFHSNDILHLFVSKDELNLFIFVLSELKDKITRKHLFEIMEKGSGIYIKNTINIEKSTQIIRWDRK